MKFLLLGFLLVLVLLAGRRLLALGKVPEPEFQRLATLRGGVEIREYSALVVARTALSRRSLGGPANEGFRRVARYLFGGNDRSESMAMTAPVVMEMGEQPSLYFYMPFNRRLEDLPSTSDPGISLQTVPARTLGVMRFGGYAGDHDIEHYGSRLKQILQKEGWAAEGPLLYMGYNAPWTLVGRRNEVAFQVRRSP
jgi:hypothetical protein